jgi:hypothetical protein
MKKILFLLFIVLSSYTLFAQTDTTAAGTKMKTKTESDGTIKTKTKSNGDMDNPDTKIKTKTKSDGDMDDAGKTKTKRKNKSGDADNMNNGTMSMTTTTITTNTNMVTMGGWTTNPANLPVVGTNVSADVVTTLKNKYGATIYDIKQIKSSAGLDIYVVRVMDNGTIRTDYVGADGNTVPQ